MIASIEEFEKEPAPGVGAGGYHAPVLPAEVVEALRPEAGKCIVDCTLGGGGHSELLLEAGATVIGIDQDLEAIAYASERAASVDSTEDQV